VSAGVFYGIGGALPVRGDEGTFYNASGGLTTAGYAVRTLAYGAAGGVMETLQGGRFGHGFVSAGVSAASARRSVRLEMMRLERWRAPSRVARPRSSRVESSRMGR